MKILLDECAPWPMWRLLAGHTCSTAQRMGWGAVKNGALLQLAEARFDLFITCDQGIAYQQNLSNRRIAVLALSTNNLRRIEAAAPLICGGVSSIGPGEFRRLDIP